MDLTIILTVLASMITVIGFIYGFIRNSQDDMEKKFQSHKVDIKNNIDAIKDNINAHIDRLEKKLDRSDRRADMLDFRMNSLDERMFLALTGKKLEDAILEEKMKRPKTDP